MKSIFTVLLFFCLTIFSQSLLAEEIEIGFWTKNDPVDFRNGSILLAAIILNEELKIEGSKYQVKVKVQSWAGGKAWGNLKQAFSLAMEANKGPHIVLAGHENISVWGQAGLIQPIQNFLDRKTWPLNDIIETLWTPMTWNAKIWAVPQDAEARPLYFWKQNYKKIGYSPGKIAALPDQIKAGKYTLYNMLEDAKKMQDQGIIKKGFGFYPRPKKGDDFWQFYVAFGGQFVDAKSGSLVLTKSALTKYYQFFHDAVFKYQVTSKNHLGTEWSSWHSAVTTGKVGIWHGGTWQQAQWTSMIGSTEFFKQVSFALIPAGEQGQSATTLTHPMAYMLSKYKDKVSEETHLAARLIKIASEPRINTMHALKSAHLGTTKSQLKMENYYNDRWAFETSYLLEHAFAIPNNTDFGQYADIIWNGLTAVWSGRSDATSAVNRVLKDMKMSMEGKVLIR